jgi:hypothetical protein
MNSITPIGAVKSLGAEIGKSVVADILKDQGAKGLGQLEKWANKTVILNKFAEQINSLGLRQGMLVGFSDFEAPDGKVYTYGPYFLGAGDDPAAPLIDLGYSNAGVRDLGNSALTSLSTPAGLKWKSMSMYWVFKEPGNKVQLSAVDSQAILSEAMARQLASRIQANNISSLPTLRKLAEQSKHFNELEDRMRDELRSKNIEARLATCRQAMVLAETEFKAALSKRDTALENARAAQGLQTVIQLFNLAGSAANLVSKANTIADYQETAAHQAATKYNTGVATYISIYKSETTINIQHLPNKPEIEVPPKN